MRKAILEECIQQARGWHPGFDQDVHVQLLDQRGGHEFLISAENASALRTADGFAPAVRDQ